MPAGWWEEHIATAALHTESETIGLCELGDQRSDLIDSLHARDARGQSCREVLEDDRSVHLARIPAAGGAVARITPRGRTVFDDDVGPAGEIVLLQGGGTAPG